jgi:fructokinase
VKQLDVLAIGEALIDLISEATQLSLVDAPRYVMYCGGQAANVALNVSRLGGTSAIMARIGDDFLGLFLRHHLARAGVETAFLQVAPKTPTTIAMVTRHTTTPDFAIYRGADAQLVPGDMPISLLPTTSLVHTSAFALSREPACSTVLAFIVEAHAHGCLISFDPNYHPRLWEMEADPLAIFAKICPYVFLAKPSLDDCIRLFGTGIDPEKYVERFLAMGVHEVVLTMGQSGVLHGDERGITYYPNKQVEVVDVTGAGDSFWAGLLLAKLDGYATAEAIRVAQAVAEIKLQQVGALSQNIDRNALYARLGLLKPDGHLE